MQTTRGIRDSTLVRVRALAEARHQRSSKPAAPRVAEPGVRRTLAEHLESVVVKKEEEDLAEEMSLMTIRDVVTQPAVSGAPAGTEDLRPPLTPDVPSESSGAASLELQEWYRTAPASEGGSSLDLAQDLAVETGSSVSVSSTPEGEGPVTWEELQEHHDRYWSRIQPAFNKKRWELAEKYLTKMWRVNSSFVERRGATLSPEQLRYVKVHQGVRLK